MSTMRNRTCWKSFQKESQVPVHIILVKIVHVHDRERSVDGNASKNFMETVPVEMWLRLNKSAVWRTCFDCHLEPVHLSESGNKELYTSAKGEHDFF